MQRFNGRGVHSARFEHGDPASERISVACFECVERQFLLRQVVITGGDHVVDHALQTQLRTVLRREDSRDAISMKLVNFRRHNHAAATAEYFDMPCSRLAQHVDHVLEVFDVSALIGRHGNTVHVFLKRCINHFFYAAIVAEVNNFATAALNDAPHDVDGGIMPVKQARRCDKTNLVFRPINKVFAIKI